MTIKSLNLYFDPAFAPASGAGVGQNAAHLPLELPMPSPIPRRGPRRLNSLASLLRCRKRHEARPVARKHDPPMPRPPDPPLWQEERPHSRTGLKRETFTDRSPVQPWIRVNIWKVGGVPRPFGGCLLHCNMRCARSLLNCTWQDLICAWSAPIHLTYAFIAPEPIQPHCRAAKRLNTP